MHRSTLTRRHFLCGSLGAAGLAALLASCAPPPSPTPPQPAAQPPAAEVPPTQAPKQPVELIALERLGSVSELLEIQAGHFMEMNPDVRITVQAYPGAQYMQKIEVRAAADTLGDTMFINIRNNYFLMCDRGLFLALDPYVEAEGADLMQEFYPWAVEGAFMYEGTVYGLAEFSHPGFVAAYINKTMFDEAGVKYPDWDTTWDDALDMAQNFTRDTNNDGKTDQWGWMLPDGEARWGIYLYSFGGGYWFSDDGTKALLDSSGHMRALQWVYDIGYKHQAAVKSVDVQESLPFMFATGKQAMIHDHYLASAIYAAVGDKFEIKTCPFPYDPEYDDRDNRRTFIQVGLKTINSVTKYPEEAYRWIRYLCGREAALERIIDYSFTACPRPDVWNDPELMKIERHPIFKRYNESSNARTTRAPANLRATEINNALTASLSVIADGSKTPEEAIPAIQNELQTILDKPKP